MKIDWQEKGEHWRHGHCRIGDITITRESKRSRAFLKLPVQTLPHGPFGTFESAAEYADKRLDEIAALLDNGHAHSCGLIQNPQRWPECNC